MNNKVVYGPDGEVLTINDLPSLHGRWTIKRKAQLVAAVEGGLVTLDEVYKRYHLQAEEFLSWQGTLKTDGLPGLRVSKLQHYRAAKKAA
jgi:hypothetical protein